MYFLVSNFRFVAHKWEVGRCDISFAFLRLPLFFQVSQEISYQIFATSATFFVPLILILLLYWRIFLTAR